VALVGIAYVLVYLCLFIGRPDGERGVVILSDFGEVPLEAIGIALALAVVGREPRRQARLAWSLVAVAFASNLIGNLVYGAYDQAGQQPFPSIADAFYLGFYPLLVAGLLAMPTASTRRDLFAWRVWSNVAIVILGGGMALVHFVLMPTIAQLSADPLATTISLAYPAGDLALLAALATIAARRPYAGDRATLALLMVAVSSWFFADLAFAILSASGSYAPGGIADVIWLAGDLGFVLAAQASLASLPRPDRDTPGETLTLSRFGPYAMLGLGLATLVLAAIGAQAEIALLAVLAAVLTALVVFRQLIDENQRRQAEDALVAEHMEAAARATQEARHDALTGLPNRTKLYELLQAEFAGSRLTGRPVTLALVDLNNFKGINDHFGHAAGDRLLVEVARRLEQSVRESDAVTRLGGDEFAIVLPATSAARGLEVADRAKAELERPFVLAGDEIAIGGAFGLATYPDSDVADEDGLMRRADIAMYRAKRGRLGPTSYAASFEQHGPDASLLAMLRTAIDGDGLILEFQPIRERLGGKTIAVEALVRWRHPSRGVLAPSEFLPLASQAGLIRAIDVRVVELACSQAAVWVDAGLQTCVDVNVSRDSLEDPGFLDVLRTTLERHALPGSLIVLEVTEDGFVESPERARDFVERACQLGVRTAIDDFGAGFSSLRRLQELPVDYLKIDRSFVTGALAEVQNAVIVEAVVSLAHRLGKSVVAEGVEDEATLVYLDRLGVDLTQGFHIGRPVPPGEIVARLRAETEGFAPTPS
jgi:diguanylate cyclase (GGDEF)-like protein